MLRFNRLTSKLLFAIVLWLAGALFFVTLTLNLTWGVEDRGVAINEAGSLRKQTYLMVIYFQSGQHEALQTELTNFETKLASLAKLSNRSFFKKLSYSHSDELEQVKVNFVNFKRLLYTSKTDVEVGKTILPYTEQFVDKIDTLVKSIERQNTNSIRLVQLAQLLLIVMVVVSAFISIALLNRLVIRPLLSLKTGIQEISAGNLSLRLNFKTGDEFSQISEGFNQMASSLHDFYQHLEEKVTQKTLDLARTNEELSVLYRVTSIFHQGSANTEALTQFLEKVVDLTQAQAGSIRLLDEQAKRMDTVAQVNLPQNLINNPACNSIQDCLCGSSYQYDDKTLAENKIYFPLTQEASKTQFIACERQGFSHILIYPIVLRDQEFGLLTFYFSKDEGQLQPGSQLIRLLCTQLAVAIENERLALKEQQFAVLEERNIMAQGLHDSIAQSLSFLNLQLQLLKQALDKSDQEKTDKHIKYLNLGVQQCYDDVRELLNNFRFKLNKGTFEHVLQTVIERFKAQNSANVSFNYVSNGPDLSPLQQLQLVFILQEALSNVRKHARASQVSIVFKNTDNIYLCIQDNGVGFDVQCDKEKQGHHIGLSIMRERAARINGQLMIRSTINQGSTIEIIVASSQR